jgi:thiol-disulfide isomerase/thioredoxin
VKRIVLLVLTVLGLVSAQTIDREAPDFKLYNSATGEVVQLSSLRGRPVVVNFWASWCGPCRAEFPQIHRAFLKRQDKFVFLAVGSNEAPEASLRYMRDNKFTFTVLTDAPGDFKGEADQVKAIARLYGVYGIPTTYFVDANGQIQAIQYGSMSVSPFEDNLKKIGVR